MWGRQMLLMVFTALGRPSFLGTTQNPRTKEFMEAGKERLARDTLRDATQQEVLQLKRENGDLKQLVAELSLDGYRLKKTAIPIPHHAAGTRG